MKVAWHEVPGTREKRTRPGGTVDLLTTQRYFSSNFTSCAFKNARYSS